MTLHDRFAHALTRIASATSVARQREVEAVRAERRGDDGLLERLGPIVDRFEALADEMEATLS